jgi:predicted Rossmann-fold nucleotide-binding protein
MDRRALLAALGAPDLPYDPLRRRLYTPKELLAPHPRRLGRSLDDAIYDHYVRSGGRYPSIRESLARRLHDFSVDEALVRCIGRSSSDRVKLVGLMGGHSVPRSSSDYREAATVGFELFKHGYKVATGGGPGIMEAGNLGAYIASEWGRAELRQALDILHGSPALPESEGWRRDRKLVADFEGYQRCGREVLARFPRQRRPRRPRDMANFALPTWFYGWEPTNLFADVVAKYFSNSLREDGLLAICVGGLIYAPGGMGTTQEVFQDAAQNHYDLFDWISPMVFLGRSYWHRKTSHYRLISELSAGRQWGELVTLADRARDVVAFIARHPARPM